MLTFKSSNRENRNQFIRNQRKQKNYQKQCKKKQWRMPLLLYQHVPGLSNMYFSPDLRHFTEVEQGPSGPGTGPSEDKTVAAVFRNCEVLLASAVRIGLQRGLLRAERVFIFFFVFVISLLIFGSMNPSESRQEGEERNWPIDDILRDAL